MLEMEILPEIGQIKKKRNDFINTRGYGYTPASTGDYVNDIRLNCDHVHGMNMQFGCPTPKGYIALSELLLSRAPVVLVFYSTASFKAEVVNELESLAKDTEVMGGKMILVANQYHEEILNALGNKRTLTIYHDHLVDIAKDFGLYQQHNPLPDWLSGIEHEKAFLPSIYVINSDRKIIFNYVDFNFTIFANEGLNKNNMIREMLNVVFHEHKNEKKLN